MLWVAAYNADISGAYANFRGDKCPGVADGDKDLEETTKEGK